MLTMPQQDKLPQSLPSSVQDLHGMLAAPRRRTGLQGVHRAPRDVQQPAAQGPQSTAPAPESTAELRAQLQGIVAQLQGIVALLHQLQRHGEAGMMILQPDAPSQVCTCILAG